MERGIGSGMILGALVVAGGLGAVLASGGCMCAAGTGASEPAAAEKKLSMSKTQAIERATRALQAEGWDPERYDVTVDETAEAWEIWFRGKPPRRPGDEMMILIAKRDGSVQIHRGE